MEPRHHDGRVRQDSLDGPAGSFRPLVQSLTGDRHARPRITVAVHSGSRFGELKEACFVFARPGPVEIRGADPAKWRRRWVGLGG